MVIIISETVPTIKVKDALKENNIIFVDTRTPAEYEEDHIPEAINIPLFDNDQRAIIGTVYKKNKKEAYNLGLSLYEKRMVLLKEKISLLNKKKKIIIYCWRGGMRSKTITKLVNDEGFNAIQLFGGYKEFRAYIREKILIMKPKFTFIVLNGLAGCGKTDILKKITPSIDLEGIARHRSSLFGAIGLIPNNQKNFETKLYFLLKKFEKEKFVFIEGENQKVGNLFVPKNIFSHMKKGIAIRINSSIEKRIERIINDYFTHNEDKKIIEIISSLKQALTKKVVDKLIRLMKNKNYSEVSRILLEDYYDSRYEYFMKNVNYQAIIINENVKDSVKELLKIKNNL